jgi:Uma2 family endonuclease
MSIAQKAVKPCWDYDAYAALPEDGKRHEIIDGEHYVNPAPNLYHQKISGSLHFQLFSQIELGGHGSVFYAPVDLQLSDHDIVQPDLVVISQQRRHIMSVSRLTGAPDLVIEILSPSNPQHDLHIKRRLYEHSGIPEYWIVDPEQRQVLQLHLQGGRYEELVQTTTITMKVAPYVTVDLARIW